MNKVLITGFQNFGDYSENTTEVLKKNVRLISSHAVEYMIFPVRIFSNGAENYGKQIIARAKEINAKAIISLGMASDVRGLRIKSRAINWVENEKYCLPEEHKRVLDKNLPPKYELDVDLSRWQMKEILSVLSKINVVYETEISTDANAFCCNALMFRTLQAMQESEYDIPYIYLQLPCTANAVKNLPKFDKNKHITSVCQVSQILSIFTLLYKRCKI